MDELLSVKNLKKYFPGPKRLLGGIKHHVRAVDDISFHIRPGETLGLVGESGCGKSTIGRLLLRLISPTAGSIFFRGDRIHTLNRRAMRPYRKHLQIIFQDPYSSLNPRMMVKDIIGEGLKRTTRISAIERRERVLDIMEKVGLRPEQYSRYPHEFSGGQRQRICIARAIVMNPALVVADEPVSALDVSIQAQVINLLERLREELNLSYLFISHDLSVVEHISDRIAVMYLGKIVEMADRNQLYNDPQHPYTIALLSALPLPQVGRKKKRIILHGDIPSPLNPPSGCRFHTRCSRATGICRDSEPELKEGDTGHFIACHGN
ncbi:MAG: dipeptide ABC transporter ATP-binding protein [Desulfobacteraceae bacterium]|nr:dipeptide ABC transporter ATP-binding protein [Desulfobacteraceae bacterium]